MFFNLLWNGVPFPYGNTEMALTTQEIGTLIRETRKKMKVTQRFLALTSGTGLRFLIELEKGKETCQIGKTLTVLQTLGIRIQLTPPATADGREQPWQRHSMSTCTASLSGT